MKILKYILIGILVIIGIILIISAFIPAQLFTVQTISINAPAVTIYEEVIDLKKWDKWSPWYALDSAMEQKFSEPSAGKDASVTWKSKTMGEGKQTIVEAEENKRIKTLLKFGDSDGLHYSEFIFTDSAGATNVSWSFNGDETPYVFRLMNLFMKKTLEREFKNGLNNLKKISEEKPASVQKRDYSIHETELPVRVYIAKRDSLSFEKIPVFFETNMGNLFKDVGKAGLQVAGAPTGLYFSWDEKNMTTVMAVAVPVKGDAKTSLKGYETVVVPAGKNLHIVYTGPYEGSADAHYAMDAYMKEKNMEQITPVIEEYITGPEAEPDTNKWVTNIYYPVK